MRQHVRAAFCHSLRLPKPRGGWRAACGGGGTEGGAEGLCIACWPAKELSSPCICSTCILIRQRCAALPLHLSWPSAWPSSLLPPAPSPPFAPAMPTPATTHRVSQRTAWWGPCAPSSCCSSFTRVPQVRALYASYDGVLYTIQRTRCAGCGPNADAFHSRSQPLQRQRNI